MKAKIVITLQEDGTFSAEIQGNYADTLGILGDTAGQIIRRINEQSADKCMIATKYLLYKVVKATNTTPDKLVKIDLNAIEKMRRGNCDD